MAALDDRLSFLEPIGSSRGLSGYLFGRRRLIGKVLSVLGRTAARLKEARADGRQIGHASDSKRRRATEKPTGDARPGSKPGLNAFPSRADDRHAWLWLFGRFALWRLAAFRFARSRRRTAALRSRLRLSAGLWLARWRLGRVEQDKMIVCRLGWRYGGLGGCGDRFGRRSAAGNSLCRVAGRKLLGT